jgi:hypothetical protein
VRRAPSIRTRVRIAYRRIRPCLPWRGYPKAVALAAFALGIGLAIAVWLFVDPIESMVLVAPELELALAPPAGGLAVIALDPTLHRPGQSNNTHALELSGACDRLALRAQTSGSRTHEIVVRAFQRQGGRERGCDFTTARLSATKNPRSLEAEAGASVDLSGGASTALVARSHILSRVPIRSLFVASVESSVAPGGALAQEVLTGKSLGIEAGEWELTRLHLVVVNDKPMLQATLDTPKRVGRLTLEGENELFWSRLETWWSWFWMIFGTATLLDLLKLGCLERLFSGRRREVA